MKRKTFCGSARGQSALEYAFTYFWAILTVIIIGYALWQSKVFDACTYPQRGALGFSQFNVVDFAISENTTSDTANRFYAVFFNRNEEEVRVRNITLYRNNRECGGINYPAPVAVHKGSQRILSGYVYPECSGTGDQCYQYEVEFQYDSLSGTPHSDRGTVEWHYEDLGPMVINYGWRTTGFGASPLVNEFGNAIGSYQGICPAVPPSIGSMPAATSSYITWNNPGSCSNLGQLTGVGFATAACLRNASYLSHGWLAAQVYLSKAYADKSVFIGGQAYYRNATGNYTHYICVNDNFYFYVNNDLIFRGGTTGTQPNEVIRTCSDNSCASSDGWCIPPVEISGVSSFQFGVPNNVSILLEDYCVSGGIYTPDIYFA